MERVWPGDRDRKEIGIEKWRGRGRDRGERDRRRDKDRQDQRQRQRDREERVSKTRRRQMTGDRKNEKEFAVRFCRAGRRGQVQNSSLDRGLGGMALGPLQMSVCPLLGHAAPGRPHGRRTVTDPLPAGGVPGRPHDPQHQWPVQPVHQVSDLPSLPG